jgi:SagB-type dehydrogenase family enzyme
VLKLLVVVTPLAALALWVLVRALRGRPLSRYALNVVVALFLLGYLLATAGLGVFWVARMDLPAFDWHYLFGYAVVLLAGVHVALQLPVLGAFLRKALRVAPRRAGSVRARRTLSLAGIFGAVGLVVWWLSGRRRAPAALRPALVPSGAGARDAPLEPVVERDGRSLDIASYLYEESSYSRVGILRSVGLAPPRPADVKPYPGLPRVALPEPRARAGVSLAEALEALTAPSRHTPASAVGLELRELADLAFYAAGVTEAGEGSGLPLRAAASSGALYPTDLYVLARSVSGVEPGVYYYDPYAHELVRVGKDVTAVPPSLPWGLVLAATYDRTVSKYNIRSCRYLPLDAGHVAGNLALAAGALAKSLTVETWFDDARLARELSLEPETEAPLLVLHAGAARALPPSRRAARPPSDLAQAELTRLAQKLTAWELAAETTASDGELRSPALADLARGAATVSLGAPKPSLGELFDVVRRRRSFRAFARAPLFSEDLASVLVPATSLLSVVRGGAIVEAFVLVRAVGGLEPGAYRFEPRNAALEPLGRGDRSSAIERAGLDQELLGRAAFVIAWSFAPERLGRLDGARDFRSAGLAAGFAGAAAYLAATARGLGVCGVGAFYDREVNALFSDRARVIYLMGVGARA